MNQKEIATEILSLIDDKNKHKKQRNFFAVGLIVLVTITLIIHFAMQIHTNKWYFWVPCVLVWIMWIIAYVLYVILVNKQFVSLKLAIQNEHKIVIKNKIRLLEKLFYFRNINKIPTELIAEELVFIYKNKIN